MQGFPGVGVPGRGEPFFVHLAATPRGRSQGGPHLEEAIQKANVLIEALTWIRHFRGKVTVIKLGGSVMEDDRAMIHLLLDIVFMETVGMRPVVVHGGGAAISRAMAEAGLRAALRPRTPLHRRRHAGNRRARAGRRDQRAARRPDRANSAAGPSR